MLLLLITRRGRCCIIGSDDYILLPLPVFLRKCPGFEAILLDDMRDDPASYMVRVDLRANRIDVGYVADDRWSLFGL